MGVLIDFQKRHYSAEYPSFTWDHSVTDRFELKPAVLVKSRTKSDGVIWQESHFCQYMFTMKAIKRLIFQSKAHLYAFRLLSLVNRNQVHRFLREKNGNGRR